MAEFRTGDILVRRKGLVLHKGLALGPDRVLHNTPERGEHVASLHEFLDGQVLRVLPQSAEARARGLAAARETLAQPQSYDLINNNCEHTVHRDETGSSRSPQLTAWAAGIGVGAAALAVTRHPGWAGAAGVAAAKAVGGFARASGDLDDASDGYARSRYGYRDRTDLERVMRPVQNLLKRIAGR